MRSKVPSVVVGILLVLIVASPARADFALGDWRFLQPLELPPEAAPDQPVELIIDEDVFAFSNARLSDLRIVDDLGSETGYLLETLKGQLIRSKNSLQISARVEDEPSKSSIFDFDRGQSGVPFHRVTLESPSSNFSRSVTVQVSNDGEHWRTAVSTEIFAYTVGTNPVGDLEISVPEPTDRYLRIIVFNEDNPPIEITAVVLEGYAKRLVFLADPARTYALYYGKDGSSTPVYDTARVLSRTSTFNLPEVIAGSHRDNPGYAAPVRSPAPVPPPPPVVPFTERLPWLIPAAVVLAALAVGALLLSILRKAKSLTPPPV